MRNYVWGLAVMAVGGLGSACSASPTQVSEPTEPVAEEAEVEIEIDFEVSEHVRVYRGEDGLRVTLVPLLGEEPEQALIEVTGLPNDFDGLVLRYEMSPAGRDRWSYYTTYRGGEFHTMWHRRHQGETRVQIFLPGSGRDSRDVTYDEDASAEVDPHDLARRHAAIVADGTVAALAEFDRENREARNDEEFASRIASDLERECGADPVPTSIDWSTVSDEDLRRYSVAGRGYCGAISSGLSRLCRHEAGREIVRARVRAIHCEMGDEMSVSISDDGKLVWVGDFEGMNSGEVAANLLRTYVGRDRIVLRAERGVYVALNPGDATVPIYISEDGETFNEQVELDRSAAGDHRLLFAPGIHSALRYRDDAWQLTCDELTHELRELPLEQAHAMLDAADLEERIWKREPFALARDDRGRYYYVDRLADRYGGKGFRVFSGMRGNVRLTRLVDIVNDSEGTVFATANGDLRLILNRDEVGEAYWVQGRGRTSLTVLPIHRNLELIYRGLGVYAGERLGSICELL
jgi:hypothetical protein